MNSSAKAFNLECNHCPRLANFLINIREQYPDYHARPVPAFGNSKPGLLIVGLAPGMHGANATGRPFTGDHAGILLYEMLYRHGFSNRAESRSRNDRLKLINCRITNAVKCLPPQNKPTAAEINNCNQYLAVELQQLADNAIILCLGQIAHKSVISALALKQNLHPFKHGAVYQLANNMAIMDSYHCSRYNTQTRRLTENMFDDIFRRIKQLLDKSYAV